MWDNILVTAEIWWMHVFYFLSFIHPQYTFSHIITFEKVLWSPVKCNIQFVNQCWFMRVYSIHVDYLLLLHVFNQWHSQIENIRLFSFYFKSQCMVDISVMLILMRILIHIYIYIAKQFKHIFVSLLEAFQNLTYII